MSAEIEQPIGLDDCRCETYGRDVIALRVVGRLDDIVGERSPSTSLCNGTGVRGALRNRSLTGNFIEILDQVKSGKTDPAQNEQRRDKLPPHAADYLDNPWDCQVDREPLAADEKAAVQATMSWRGFVAFSLSSRIDSRIPYNGRTEYTQDARRLESPESDEMAAPRRCRSGDRLAAFDYLSSVDSTKRESFPISG